MITTATQPTGERLEARKVSSAFPDWDERVLNVVIAYEQFEDAISARTQLDLLAGTSRHSIRFDIRARSFATLNAINAADIAMANGADLMIVSASGDGAVTSEVARWIERCVADNPHGPRVLVGMHREDGSFPQAFYSSLAAIADKWNVRLVRGMDPHGGLDADVCVGLLAGRSGRACRFAESITCVPPRYELLGLNE